MKTSKLAAIKTIVAQEIAAGTSQRQLAVKLGMSPSSVCRFLRNGDVQQIIEREKLNFIRSLPNAVDNIISLVAEFQHLPHDDSKGRELAFRATKLVLEAFNLLSSAAPAPAPVALKQKIVAIDWDRI